MSTTTQTTTTGKKARIENYDDVTAALVRHSRLNPEGDRDRVIVDNPRSLQRTEAPRFLRVSMPRKGFTFRVIEAAEAFDLKVADVWQHDEDKANDVIVMKLVVDE